MTSAQLDKRESTLLYNLVKTYRGVAGNLDLRVRAIRRGGSFVTLCIGDCSWISILLGGYNPSIPDAVVPFSSVRKEVVRDKSAPTFDEERPRPKDKFSICKFPKSNTSAVLSSAECAGPFSYVALPLGEVDKSRFTTVEFYSFSAHATDGYRLHSATLPASFPFGDFSMTRATFNFVAKMLTEGDDVSFEIARDTGWDDGFGYVRARSKKGDWQVLSRTDMDGIKRSSAFTERHAQVASTPHSTLIVRTEELTSILDEMFAAIDGLFIIEFSMMGADTFRVRALQEDEVLQDRFLHVEVATSGISSKLAGLCLPKATRFNASYLREALCVGDSHVRLQFPEEEYKPTLIRSTDDMFCTLLMPIKKG